MDSVALESSRRIALVEATNIGLTTVGELASEVTSIASKQLRSHPAVTARRATLLRHRILGLLDGPQPPPDRAELYLLAGQLSRLLAHCSKDLAHFESATVHGRLSLAFGQAIGHKGLIAWARGMQALIAFWLRRPLEAQAYVSDGLAHVSTGTTASWLRGIEARSLASTGRGAAAERAIEQSSAARSQRVPDDMCEILGGASGYSQAKAAYYATNALCWAGLTDRAVDRAHEALRLYSTATAAERSITGEATVRTDLAILWSGAGDLESAAEVLEPVFELETDYRTAGLRQQLSRVRVVAARSRSRGAGLVERIDDWCSRATAPSAERSQWHAAGTLAE